MQTWHKKTHKRFTARQKCSRPRHRIDVGPIVVAQELSAVHTRSALKRFQVYTSVKMTFYQKHPSLVSVSFFFHRAFRKHFIIVSRAQLFWVLLSACLMPDVMSEYRSADLQNRWQTHIEFFQLLTDGHQHQKWPWMHFNKLFNSMFHSFGELNQILRASSELLYTFQVSGRA